MNRVREHRNALSVIAALALPLGVAALLIPFRSVFANTAAALVLVPLVVAVATIGNRAAGIVATVSATLWFDVFLTRPYERLAITHRPDIETAVCLFIVGVVVTELCARNRHHHQVAVEEADYVGLIYGFSELAASGSSAEDVIEHGRRELVRLLDLKACRYDGSQSEKPMHRLDHDGHVRFGGTVWGVENIGLPGPELELLVYAQGDTRGRFVLTPTPGRPVSFQRRLVANSIADQNGSTHQPRRRSA
jgi:K+-sensing histidine kinase KdpD